MTFSNSSASSSESVSNSSRQSGFVSFNSLSIKSVKLSLSRRRASSRSYTSFLILMIFTFPV